MNDKLPTNAKQPTTIRPQIPEVVVLIDEDKAAEISAALEVAKSITRVGSDNFEEANRATKAIAQLSSGLEKSRKEIKAPFLAAGRAIDDAAREHTATLDAAKRRLADLVGAHLEEEQRMRREEERRQREAIEAAARQAAEAERLAREEEERRQREIEAAKRREEEAARKAAAEADAAKRAELEAQARREAEAAAELEAKAREDQDAMDDILEEAAVVELPEVREKKKSAVSFREVEEVVVVDLSKVPARVNGIQIIELKVANAKKLLSAGVAVPGLRLVKTRKAIARAR